MVLFTEEERSLIYSLFNDLFQNWNTRSLDFDLLQSILNKFQSTQVLLTEQESTYVQYWIRDRAELYSRIADQRSQHILQSQNSQGFGRDHGGQANFFNGPKMYQLCQSVLAKLVGS